MKMKLLALRAALAAALCLSAAPATAAERPARGKERTAGTVEGMPDAGFRSVARLEEFLRREKGVERGYTLEEREINGVRCLLCLRAMLHSGAIQEFSVLRREADGSLRPVCVFPADFHAYVLTRRPEGVVLSVSPRHSAAARFDVTFRVDASGGGPVCASPPWELFSKAAPEVPRVRVTIYPADRPGRKFDTTVGPGFW